MSDLQKPKKPKRPATPEPKAKPKLELVRIELKPPKEVPPENVSEKVTDRALAKTPPLADIKLEVATEPENLSEVLPEKTPPLTEKVPNIKLEVATEPENLSAEAPVVPRPPKGVQPITPPTEPLQYRAIGLVDGRFVPDEEEPNKGTLVTSDGTAISCAVLGKMMAIIKRKLQPDRSYLWVVYPRTQKESGDLHLQITGVWAPVELGKSDQPVDPGFPDGYFSIRGEVVQVEPDRFVVKIKRTDVKAATNQALRKFKLKILGVVPGDKIGYFWDLQVRRQGQELQLVEGSPIEVIPKKPFVRKRGRPKGKPQVEGEKAVIEKPGADKPVLEKPHRVLDRPRRPKPRS